MLVRGMLVINGAVDNVAVFKSKDDLPQDWVLAPNSIGPGYTDNGDGTFSPPEVVEE